MGHQKLSFPPHSWGHPWTQMCGPDPGPLGNNPSEMVIVVVAAQRGQGLEEAVNSSLGPSSSLASPLAPWHRVSG